MTKCLLMTAMLLLLGCGGSTSEETDKTGQCPAYFDMYAWRCASHLEVLRDNGEDTGATQWCEGDSLMSCTFACATCNNESRCDAQPSADQPCEWGCSDDLRGNASCNEEPIEPLCSEATCAAGVSCTLSIEGTGTCDSPPAGGMCRCDDGQWSCMTNCPEECPLSAPAEGDPCETDELTCRYYYDGTFHCTDGTWST